MVSEVADDYPEGRAPLRNVRVTETLFRELGASGVDWGEPDADGFYTPSVRRDAITLDAAWAAVEAALPEGGFVESVRALRVPYRRDLIWQAVAWIVESTGTGWAVSGEADTPAAALLALAEKLAQQ